MILFHQENDRKLTLWLSISWAVLITPKCPRIIGVLNNNTTYYSQSGASNRETIAEERSRGKDDHFEEEETHKIASFHHSALSFPYAMYGGL